MTPESDAVTVDQPLFLDSVRVLIIDDDEDDAFVLRRHLSMIEDREFVVEWVATYDEACERIFARQHDVYLVDAHIENKTGIELLELVEPGQRDEPFIIMSDDGSKELLAQSMSHEAADFIIKGSFDAEMLSKAIIYALQRKADEHKRTEHLLELNRSKDEFISIASHQLRTPATGVKQYLGLLREGFIGELTEAQQDILNKAYESNERQLSIVNDLLRVARVDAGKVILRPEKIDVRHLVQDVIAELSDVLKQRTQKVELDVQAKQPLVVVDESSMRMVLENIIENASKYSPAATTIVVQISETDELVEVDIIDEGVGVDEEHQGRLFEKFSRIDNALSTKVGGTGLGLYWAKKMVDLHGGELSYESNVPNGSVFRIKMPKQ